MTGPDETERSSASQGVDTDVKRTDPAAVEEWELISRMDDPLLSVQDLHTHFDTEQGTVAAADGVSLEIGEGEIVGLVGESGCGKSVTSRSLMGLVPKPGYVDSGEVRFEGEDLLSKTRGELRKIRGNDVSMIFQEPAKALNPVYDIGWQVGEPLRVHEDMKNAAARERAVELLGEVGIPSPENRVDDYPHEFSGGMRQRAMIAMALACEPKLLIADEPTTALDVTIQAQILDIVRDLNEELGMAVLMITHDLGVVAETCDRVAVMYAGRIVEYGDVDDIFDDPRHPYTKGLLDCVPDPRVEQQELTSIEGEVPPLHDTPDGCNFAPRCPYAIDECRQDEPRLREVGTDHYSACIWEDPR